MVDDELAPEHWGYLETDDWTHVVTEIRRTRVAIGHRHDAPAIFELEHVTHRALYTDGRGRVRSR